MIPLKACHEHLALGKEVKKHFQELCFPSLVKTNCNFFEKKRVLGTVGCCVSL